MDNNTPIDLEIYLKSNNLINLLSLYKQLSLDKSKILSNLKILIKLYYELKKLNVKEKYLELIHSLVKSQLNIEKPEIFNSLDKEYLFDYFVKYIIKYLSLFEQKMQHIDEFKPQIQVTESSESIINALLYLLFIIFTKNLINDFYKFIFSQSRQILITKYPQQVSELLYYVVSQSNDYVRELLTVLNDKDIKVNTKITQYEANLSKLLNKLDELNQEKNKIETDIQKLEEKRQLVTSLKSSTDAKIERLRIQDMEYKVKETRKNDIKKKLSELSKQLELKEKQATETNNEIERHEKLLQDLNIKIDQTKQVKQSLATTISDMKITEQTNKTEIDEIDKLLELLKKEIEILKKDQDVINTKSKIDDKDDKELEQLKKQYEQNKKAIKKIQDEINKGKVVKELASTLPSSAVDTYAEFLKMHLETIRAKQDKKQEIPIKQQTVPQAAPQAAPKSLEISTLRPLEPLEQQEPQEPIKLLKSSKSNNSLLVQASKKPFDLLKQFVSVSK